MPRINPSKNHFAAFVILLTCAIFLAGCAPASPAATTLLPETATFTPLPTLTWTPLPSLAPTASPSPLPTGTPTPSPTPEPPADLHDIATWPENMRTYYERDPSEWNHPTQEYMSDSEFHSGLIAMRRAFLAEQGVADAETMSEQDLFLAYVQHGYQHPGQILKLSPIEKRNIMTGPFMPAFSIRGVVTPGIFFENRFDHQPTQEELSYIQSAEYAGMQNHVFGELIEFDRPAYGGTIATLVGLVESVGRRADDSIECLMYYEQQGQGYWAIISVAFTPEQHLAGEEFISVYYGFKTFTNLHNYEGNPTWLGLGPGRPTLQNFVDNIGRRIWLKSGGESSMQTSTGEIVSVGTELTASGIECASNVIFDSVSQPPKPELPWDN